AATVAPARRYPSTRLAVLGVSKTRVSHAIAATIEGNFEVSPAALAPATVNGDGSAEADAAITTGTVPASSTCGADPCEQPHAVTTRAMAARCPTAPGLSRAVLAGPLLVPSGAC